MNRIALLAIAAEMRQRTVNNGKHTSPTLVEWAQRIEDATQPSDDTEVEKLQPPRWTQDCQGKQDFDGALLSVLTRYWPTNYRADKLHSAKGVLLLLGEEIAEYETAARTEFEVKSMIESWVVEVVQHVRRAMFRRAPQPITDTDAQKFMAWFNCESESNTYTRLYTPDTSNVRIALQRFLDKAER